MLVSTHSSVIESTQFLRLPLCAQPNSNKDAVSVCKRTNNWMEGCGFQLCSCCWTWPTGFIILSHTGQNRISAKESMVYPYYYMTGEPWHNGRSFPTCSSSFTLPNFETPSAFRHTLLRQAQKRSCNDNNLNLKTQSGQSSLHEKL